MLFRTSEDYKKAWRLKKLANSAGFRRLHDSQTLKMSDHKLYRPVKGFGNKPDTAFETHHSKEYLFLRKAEGEIDSSDSDTDTEKDTMSTSLSFFSSFESNIS